MRRSGITGIAILSLALAGWLSASRPGPGRVLVLDDFETPGAIARWEGPIDVVPDHASHGSRSGRVRLDDGNAQLSSAKLASDWSGYERLLFDIHSDREGISYATIRIYDAKGGDRGQAARNDYFEASNKIFLQQGWNHIEVRLTPLKAASYLRDVDLKNIRRVVLAFDSARMPWTIHLDNLRLVSGEERPETASRVQPQDTVSIIENRWVTVRQVARPEDVPESAAVTRLRTDAEREFELLQKTIQAAQTQGVETIYAERRLVTADLGLRVRPLLAWYNNNEKKTQMFEYVAGACRSERHALEDILRGVTALPETDDTQFNGPSIRPFPALRGRPVKNGFFVDERGEPMMVLSVHSPSHALERFFASPLQHIESYSVGGGSRWTIDESPVYAAFQQDEDTHRVGWDGWCGHLVRDLSSMGGTKKENVVICLESPRIRRAVADYIRVNIPKFHANPELLYNIMAYELMYICYCDRSRQMFHQWLEKKYGRIEQANSCWGVAYKSFAEVVPPPVRNSRPLADVNRGLWYDWARFNQDRFTDYLLWVRGEIRKIDASEPLAAGGSSSMLAGRTGTTGIDEERIVNEVDDVIIHEGGGSTLGMDLQRALSETKKPLADPEMSVRAVEYLLPHFLHGKSVAQLFHWPVQPGNEFHSTNLSSLAHSWNFPLADVDELLRVALDVRRLHNEVAAFADAPAEAAILYSQTSTLQLPPEMLTWATTPYLEELRKAYEASQYLDARVTFVTERQINKGWLSRYKLLIVPGARNVPTEVATAIWDYASNGGRVLIMPESLLGDEYNRPRNYLEPLGISIRETWRPKPSGTRRMVQGYDQSFSQSVKFTTGAAEKLKPAMPGAAEMEVRGLRQVIETAAGAEVLFRFADRSLAIVRTRLGQGAVDYVAGSLEEQSYASLLDGLFTEAGVGRTVRVRPLDGAGKWKVEARFARLGSRKLLYVTNFNGVAVHLALDAPSVSFTSLRELRDQQAIQGNQITVPAHQTAIYEML